jgi:hypothetical protein
MMDCVGGGGVWGWGWRGVGGWVAPSMRPHPGAGDVCNAGVCVEAVSWCVSCLWLVFCVPHTPTMNNPSPCVTTIHMWSPGQDDIWLA